MKKSILSFLITTMLAVTLLMSASGAVLGDIDGNGKVNSTDARLALRYTARLQTLTQAQLTAADMDGNGRVTSADARRILRIAAHLEPQPTEPPATTEAPMTQPPVSTAPPVTETPAPTNAPVSGTLTPKQVYNKAVKYTVEIHASGSNFSAVGSGFCIDDEGRIVTNYHVIDDATAISVIDGDGNQYNVTDIIAYDKNIDIAILKTDAKTGAITPATLGSAPPETADTIYTLGSSQGLTGTFTQGIISNAARIDPTFNSRMTYIQIDAPITQGNSGGPLINELGEVIGINTWGYTEGQNLNFAIPIRYLNDLYYGNPISIATFSTEIPHVSTDPTSGIYSGYPVSDVKASAIRPNGTACVLFAVTGCSESDYARLMESELAYTGVPTCVSVSDSGWFHLIDSDGGIQPAIFVLFTGKQEVAAQTITISIKDDPAMAVSYTLTVAKNANGNYFEYTNVPDFGVYSGMTPVSIDLVSYGRYYSTASFEYSNLSRHVSLDDYSNMLIAAGYTFQGDSGFGLFSKDYYYTDADDHAVTLSVSRTIMGGTTLTVSFSDIGKLSDLS